MATVPDLQTVGSSISARLKALEDGCVTAEALTTALEAKLDKTGIAVAATKATQDADGNPIKSTYATKTELSGKQDKGDYLTTGTANTTYLKKADAQTTYLGISAKAASAATADSATKATQDASGNVITDTYLTKSAAATTYLGISAKAASASTADSATKATSDANGRNIANTYGTKTEVGQRILASGNRGALAGYETSGTATTINAASPDCNETGSNVSVENGTTGTAWVKIVRLTAEVTVSLGEAWHWENDAAPTIAAGGVLTLCWCGSGGIAKFASPAS